MGDTTSDPVTGSNILAMTEPSLNPLHLALVGAQRAMDRHVQAGVEKDYITGHIAACEAVLLLVSVDSVFRGERGPNRDAYEEKRRSDPEGLQLLGLRYLRDFIAHDPVIVARDGGKPFNLARWIPEIHGEPPRGAALYISPAFVWPATETLTTYSTGEWSLHVRDVYNDHLSGRKTSGALGLALNWCWWHIGEWEGAGTEAPEGTYISTSERACNLCDGPIQVRTYPSSPPGAYGRVTFWCLNLECAHNTHGLARA